jgi:hypothetical protein
LLLQPSNVKLDDKNVAKGAALRLHPLAPDTKKEKITQQQTAIPALHARPVEAD